MISSGGTDPGSVCGGVRQLLCTFLSLSLSLCCVKATFNPISIPLYCLLLPPFPRTPSLPTLHHVFFPSDTVFFPSVSEYIVASGCECALSTCCNLDRFSLPLSLSLPPCLLVLLYFCILAAASCISLPQQAQDLSPV